MDVFGAVYLQISRISKDQGMEVEIILKLDDGGILGGVHAVY